MNFKIIVRLVEHSVDLLVIPEMKVQDVGVFQGLFSLPGLGNIFLTRDTGRERGIALYVKKSWYVVNLDVSFKYAECLSLKLSSNIFCNIPYGIL